MEVGYKELQTPLENLKHYFGYSSFRKNQEAIISAITGGHDSLCIMPTGAGKSICYQIPALQFKGLTIVISPLISLMKDQVDSLSNSGVPAVYLNSTVSFQNQEQIMNEISQGHYKLVYIAPERFQANGFVNFLNQLPIDLIAIDEAHCISQWGHDFRPSYGRLGQFIQGMSQRPIIAAFTATATKEVIEDINTGLHLSDPEIFISGYERENLAFSVVKTGNKRQYLLDILKRYREESGVIYAATRKDVEELLLFLKKNDIQAVGYHGGMSEGSRTENQEKFIYDDEKIIVATNAFGMGIDKSNVRFVVHYQLPKSMEAYYQEAGRAGRDGESSECVLLYTSKDVQTQKFLVEQSNSDEQRKEHEYRKLQNMVDYCHTTQCLQSFIIHYFGDENDMRCNKCSNCLSNLEERDVTIDAQKIFSCIVRMKERFGVTLIAQVLKGSKSKRLKQMGLDQLSTYGVMEEKTEKEISELIQLFCAEGYLAVSGGQYPTVKLTEKAVAVLKERVPVYQKVREVPQAAPAHSELFDCLRRLRKEIAETEKLPPYIIFSDATLKEMTRFTPSSKQEMLSIKGVGELKFDKYGEAFLQEIHQFLLENPTTQKVEIDMNIRKTKTKNTEVNVPSYFYTFELFHNGHSLEEIAHLRELKLTTIEQHLLQGLIEGQQIQWERVLPAAIEEAIKEQIEVIGGEKLKPLKEALPEEISYFHIKLALCKNNILSL